MKDVVMRVARACADLDALADQYVHGLGFEVLAQWHDHDGFDGVVLGHAHAPYHLEFIHAHDDPEPLPPHKEHLLVFYLADHEEWAARCQGMEAAGFHRLTNDNPYWERRGRTYADREGGRVIAQNGAWTR